MALRGIVDYSLGMSSRRATAHQVAVIERRRSSATRPVPARKIRRQTTRRDARTAAVAESRKG